jgi:hypothetical protein
LGLSGHDVRGVSVKLKLRGGVSNDELVTLEEEVDMLWDVIKH